MSELVMLSLFNLISSLDLKYILAFESEQNLPFGDIIPFPFKIVNLYWLIIFCTNNSLSSIQQNSKI
ncbi:hypothetical protein VCHA54P496_40217 [Vibrio chagasii]|nr:hypothetical protein VCHA36P164_100114 [Vibrio chagasii]CAH6876320.1 hypothetical protein VCHA36O163_20079 [Vibrio chagasii]CAH6895873.1 hypothetical protein VCHA34O109_20075 [Vibrio chagasii]CAH7310141.1 hypothetical protein VCHA54P495_40077 [Vibrio chagasii]CAH7324326.1 hypothetical protein VCHA54P496_40217 [Vibrio chagasii]